MTALLETPRTTRRVYGLGAGETKLLLAGALAVEAVGAVLFVRALLDRRRALPALVVALVPDEA